MCVCVCEWEGDKRMRITVSPTNLATLSSILPFPAKPKLSTVRLRSRDRMAEYSAPGRDTAPPCRIDVPYLWC